MMVSIAPGNMQRLLQGAVVINASLKYPEAIITLYIQKNKLI